MRRVGIKSGVLTEDNANRIFKAFQTLFRTRGSTVVFDRKVKKPIIMSTKNLERESIAVGSIKHGATIFYSDKFDTECSQEQIDIIRDVIIDEHLPRSASKEINHYCFKTPVNVVLTKQEPERKFVEAIVNSKVGEKIDSWIKSRDQNFYGIEYSWRKGEHPTQANFNPDFFLKFADNIVVIEIKANGDDSEENVAKYRWAKQHFETLNGELEKSKIKQRYFFHFLSPSSYAEFIEYALDGRLFKGEFRSSLEFLLEK
jgi:type III restriction enzyme